MHERHPFVVSRRAAWRRGATIVSLLCAGGTSLLSAQSGAAGGGVTGGAGRIAFSNGAALREALVVELGRASGWTTVAAPRPLRGLAVGTAATLSLATPRTDGRQFPLVPVTRGDTTFFSAVSQHVLLTQFRTELRLALPVATGRVYAGAGGGGYLIRGAARNGTSARVHGGPLLVANVGYEHALTHWLEVRAAAQWMRFFDFDRSLLDATRGLPSAQRVRDVGPAAPTSRAPHAVAYVLTMRLRPWGDR